jgi:PadR family transcriptional regulator PadR
MSEIKLSLATLEVLAEILRKPSDRHFGRDLMHRTGLKSGVVYPILARLEDIGWLASTPEDPPGDGRPPRRYYRLTGLGETEGRAAVEQVQRALQLPDGRWSPA